MREPKNSELTVGREVLIDLAGDDFEDDYYAVVDGSEKHHLQGGSWVMVYQIRLLKPYLGPGIVGLTVRKQLLTLSDHPEELHREIERARGTWFTYDTFTIQPLLLPLGDQERLEHEPERGVKDELGPDGKYHIVPLRKE